MASRIALAALAGGLLSLGHAPFEWPYVALLGLPILIWLLAQACTVKDAALIGGAAGVIYFASSLRWLLEPFAVEADIYGWMAPFALFFMALGMSLFWALAFGAGKRLRNPLAIVATWPLAELLREYIFSGFPWAKPSYILIDTAFAQTASLIGPTGLFCCMVLVCTLPICNRTWGSGTALTLVVCATVFGHTKVPDAAVLTDHTVRIVQPNAPQAQKWDPQWMSVFFERALTLSRRAGSPDLIMWPETSIPFWYGHDAAGLSLLQNLPAPEFIGGILDRREGRLYNSVLHLSEREVQSFYDKHHLVPFGEYVPFAGQLGLKGMAAENGAGFSAGNGPKVLTSKIGDFLPLVCYEAIFARHASASKRPDWIAHLTNDAWFGVTLGPQQHLAQVRFRAIEQGLPVARSANTGISAMIDPYGRILQSISIDQAGMIDSRLPAPLSATLYSKFGEWAWLVLLFIGTAICFWRQYQSYPHKD